MSAKRILAVKSRRRLFWKAVVLLAAVAAALFFVRMKKEALVREGAGFLQTLLSRETKLDVRIGKISGKITGLIRFDDVRLEDPNLPAGLRVMFRAERVEFRMHPLEFLTKNFESKITVRVIDPELHWRPTIRIHSDPFPFLGTLRDLVLTQRRRFSLHVENLTLVAGVDRLKFPGIAIDYDDDRFTFEAPVRHLSLWGNDVSTEFKLRAHLEWGLLKSEDRLVGQLVTEGTVINWNPLPWESRVDFALTRDSLTLDASDLFGGFELTGLVRFDGEAQADLSLRADDYPLKNFEPLFGRAEPDAYDGHLDLEARVRGPIDALNTEAHASILGGKAGRGHYQAMNLHVDGVYPTLRIFDSQLLMEDGVSMKFAEKTVELPQLFDARTYRDLIAASSQDTVSMGGWGFKRPIDENRLPEFLLERSFGKYATLKFRKYNESDEEKLEKPATLDQTDEMEVGFEYRLRSKKDSLQYRVRDDEQFVGIERKMSF